MTSLLLEKDFTAGKCTCFVCWGGGGGGGVVTSKALVAFSGVDWLSDHLLVGRSQKENAADLRELLVTFLSKMTLYRRRWRATLWCMVHVRDCTPSWVKELPGGVADDDTLSFQYGSLVHPKWGCFRCRYRTSSCRLSWNRCCCPSPWVLPNQ